MDPGFDAGVLWAAARVVEWFDEPVIAEHLLQESGVDTSQAEEHDAQFLARITE